MELSSPADLDSVTVGQTITINVNLAGLTGGEQLELLAAGVMFPEGLFAAPTSVDAGGLVPASAGELFKTNVDSPFVDAIFEAGGDDAADRIAMNGTFFSFSLTATDFGMGQITLDFADGLLFNPDDPFEPTEANLALGNSLTVTVIPLPSGLAMMLSGVSLLTAGHYLRPSATLLARRLRSALSAGRAHLS